MAIDSRFFINHGPFKLIELMQSLAIQYEIIGDPNILVEDVAVLAEAKSSQITFFANHKYTEQLHQTKAGVCLIKEVDIPIAPESLTLVVVEDPYSTYARIVGVFYTERFILDRNLSQISPGAYVNESAKIGQRVYIESGAYIGALTVVGDGCIIAANAYIGDGVTLGPNCRIGPNASIIHSDIGRNCVVYPGARIGQDGFGFALYQGETHKITQLGRVVVGDRVEIGANTCIDRGTIEDTKIGNDTKIDNLVQIGHNVIIGNSCIIVGQVGIAGSTTLGDGVMIGGQAGVAGHLQIGAGAILESQSGVTSDIEKGGRVAGHPAVPAMQWRRQQVFFQKAVSKSDKSN